MQVNCDRQVEVDYYWEKLADGGAPARSELRPAQGQVRRVVQIVPTILARILSDADTTKSQRAMTVLLQMQKLDIAALQAAFDARSNDNNFAS